MNIREDKKYIEMEGRKFSISKFDPFFGSFLAFKLFSLTGDKKLNLPLILQSLMGGKFEEFESLSKQVLKYASEKLPSGEVPIINEENNIAIVGLTAKMSMDLFIEIMIFNLSDFFEDTPDQNPGQQLTGDINSL